MRNAIEGETEVWLTPKAEIMTHQGFQKGQKEAAFALSSPSGQYMLSELRLGNLNVCPVSVTTGCEALNKTPESLWISVSSSVGDRQGRSHLDLSIFEISSPHYLKTIGPLRGTTEHPSPHKSQGPGSQTLGDA